MFWYFWWAPEATRDRDPEGRRPSFSFMRDFEYLPNTSDWLGPWRLEANHGNDYNLEREVQRTKNFSGVATIHNQDQAVTESMGPIEDRTQEHLGQADWTIITARRALVQAARDLSERGVVPVTVDRPDLCETRSGRIVLPRNVDWVEATEQKRKAFSERQTSAPSFA